MKHLLIALVIAAIFAPLASSGDDFYDSQLNRGLRGSNPYSYLLIRQADRQTTGAKELLNQAVQYSPDLPAVHFRLASAGFSWSVGGILESIDHIVNGLNAYAGNFWWSFTFSGTLFFSLALSFVLAYIVVVAVRLPRDIPLITHDLNESPIRTLGLIVLVALSVISPLCLVAGILCLIGIYMGRTDRYTVYVFLLFLLFLPAVLSRASLYIGTPASGAVKAVIESNESRGNAYAISALSTKNEYAAAFSYALAMKREGLYKEAIDSYTRLSEGRQDPRVLVNLGNCYVGLYDFQEANKDYLSEAIKYYTQAISAGPLASAYYNLSQVSRELLDFEKGEEYYKAALVIDRAAVARFSSISGRQANRFVIDETLPAGELWRYARANSGKTHTFGLAIVAPAVVSAIAMVLLVLFVVLPGRLRHTAYRCRKCGSVLCGRCERGLVIGQICSQCYGSLLRLAELDARERVARILSVYEQQKRRRDVMKVLAFLLPGAAHIYAGKVLIGLLMLWPFLFCVVFSFVNAFLFPGSSLISHGVIGLALLLPALLIYVTSNIITRQGIAKGWL